MIDNDFPMPAYLVELDQALDEGMAKAIPLIIKQVDSETRTLLIGRVEDLLKSRQYDAYNRDHLDGIRSALEVLKGE
jgi:hypothetical protein